MLEHWQKTGGVLVLGYEMFRNLTSTGKKMKKAMQESVMKSLVDPGADLVVCKFHIIFYLNPYLLLFFILFIYFYR